MDAAIGSLKPILGELAAASKSEPKPGNSALQARVEAQGHPAKVNLDLADEVSLIAQVTLQEAEADEIKKVVAIFNANPEVFADQAPPFAKDLAKIVLAGTKLDLDGTLLTVNFNADLDELIAAGKKAMAGLQ